LYSKKDGDVNPNRINDRAAFKKSKEETEIKGALRIHFIFPNIQGGTPKTCIYGKDVLVYINQDNMDEFFDESIDDQREAVIMIKRFIRAVSKDNSKSDLNEAGTSKRTKRNKHRQAPKRKANSKNAQNDGSKRKKRTSRR
jgi:hypothetical protein